jgi:trehalose-phosphatase
MARDAAKRLAARVHRAARRPGARRVLLLDLDGTLAPIAPTPESARVPPATLEALRRLGRSGWTVAIVSGRPSSQVRRLVPVRGVRVFGSHGLEGSWRGGRVTKPDAALRRRLASLARAGARLATGTPGVRVERKPAGIAIHDRKVAPARLSPWRRDLAAWLDGQDLEGLEVLKGRRVLELRPRGIHKGTVATRLLERSSRRRGDDSLVAIGDDRTDEDLFEAVGNRGLTIRVGRAGVRTAARERLASPAAVRRFLAALAERSRDQRAASALS